MKGIHAPSPPIRANRRTPTRPAAAGGIHVPSQGRAASGPGTLGPVTAGRRPPAGSGGRQSLPRLGRCDALQPYQPTTCSEDGPLDCGWATQEDDSKRGHLRTSTRSSRQRAVPAPCARRSRWPRARPLPAAFRVAQQDWPRLPGHMPQTCPLPLKKALTQNANR